MRTLFFLLLSLVVCSGEIIPDARRITWTPGATVGVVGGIPSRSTVASTADAATYGTGSVNATSHVSTTVGNAYNSDGVAYFPAGTYRMDSVYYTATLCNLTIKGELGPSGEKLTTFKANTSTQQMFSFGGDSSPFSTSQDITSGATKGSTQFTIADTTNAGVGGARGYAAGDIVVISRSNPTYAIANAAPTSDGRIITFTVAVTSVPNGTTVNFTPPLPLDFSATPKAKHIYQPPVYSVGIEDCIIDGNDLAATLVEWTTARGCWLKNVELKKPKNRFVVGAATVNCEVNKSYLHSPASNGSNHEGLDLYDRCCGWLIVNSIVYGGGIFMGDGAGGSSGNAIAYNFAYGCSYDGNTAICDLFGNHGGHNVMNLWEGNIGGGFHSDGYHASDSHNTLLRNWITGTHPTATQNLLGVAIGRWSNYNNLVGNVIGSTGHAATLFKIGYPNLGNFSTSLTWAATTPPDYTTQSANQSGGDGHGSGGNTLQERDLNVAASASFHGNYDYDSLAQAWESTDTNVTDHTDHTMPDSYLYGSAPDWWPVSIAWPPFDPSSPPGTFNDTTLALLPAGYRYLNGADPSSGGSGSTTISGSGSTTISGSGTTTIQ